MSAGNSTPADVSERNRAAVQARLAHRERCTELASIIVAHLIDARQCALDAEADHAAAARCGDARSPVARSMYVGAAKRAEVRAQENIAEVLRTMRRMLVITMASDDPSLSGHAEGLTIEDQLAWRALMGVDAE